MARYTISVGGSVGAIALVRFSAADAVAVADHYRQRGFSSIRIADKHRELSIVELRKAVAEGA